MNEFILGDKFLVDLDWYDALWLFRLSKNADDFILEVSDRELRSMYFFTFLRT